MGKELDFEGFSVVSLSSVIMEMIRERLKFAHHPEAVNGLLDT